MNCEVAHSAPRCRVAVERGRRRRTRRAPSRSAPSAITRDRPRTAGLHRRRRLLRPRLRPRALRRTGAHRPGLRGLVGRLPGPHFRVRTDLDDTWSAVGTRPRRGAALVGAAQSLESGAHDPTSRHVGRRRDPFADGTVRPIDRDFLLCPSERALRSLSVAMIALSVAFVLVRRTTDAVRASPGDSVDRVMKSLIRGRLARCLECPPVSDARKVASRAPKVCATRGTSPRCRTYRVRRAGSTPGPSWDRTARPRRVDVRRGGAVEVEDASRHRPVGPWASVSASS